MILMPLGPGGNLRSRGSSCGGGGGGGGGGSFTRDFEGKG